MADQPLSPATDRRLGEPLPHQLANQTRVHLRAINLWQSVPCETIASCGISDRFQPLFPTPRQVTHALLTRPPLSSASIGRSLYQQILVRLACVKHAASVHPEPGSNSLIKCLMYSRQPTSLVISRHYCYKKFILLNDDSLRIFENRMCFTV